MSIISQKNLKEVSSGSIEALFKKLPSIESPLCVGYFLCQSLQRKKGLN